MAKTVPERVAAIVADRIEGTLTGDTKNEREDWEGLVAEAVETLCADDLPDGERYEKVDVKSAFKKLANYTQMGGGVMVKGGAPMACTCMW